ncbi:MAG: peptidylprolyl isomerase [Chloroflexota bacterium]
MARRRQTTGMPRKNRKSDDTPENSGFIDNFLGNPQSRAEREEALNRLIQRGTAGIVALVVIIIASVLIYDLAIVPQLPVATVNGERITVGEFRQRVAFEQTLTLQNYQARINQLQQQAAAFGVDVQQLAQNDPQLTRWQNELSSVDILGNRVIDDMVDDLLIAQEFEALGLSLEDADVEFAQQNFFSFDTTEVALIGVPATATLTPTVSPTPLVSPTPSPTPLPTNTPTVVPTNTPDPEATPEMTAEATAEAEVTGTVEIPPTPTTSQTEAFENYEESVGFFEDNVLQGEVNRGTLENFWEREAIRTAVADAIAGDIEMAIYANVRHILVETEEEATAVITALQEGESFALLARAQSTDTGSGQRGGELGWQPIDLYVEPFANAVRDAEIGVVLDPVESEFGFHIIQVNAREEREVTDQVESQIQQSRFGNWLEGQRETAEDAGNVTINENWTDFLDG